MPPRSSTAAIAAAVAVTLATLSSANALSSSYSPHPDIGYPAGLIPDCPGVTKNATISAAAMPRLQLALHRMGDNGLIIRKSMSISSAARIVAKDKHLDLKNRKTVLYAVGFWDSSLFPQSQAVANSYCRRGYNVFVTETFTFFTYIYPKSVRLARAIGTKVGDFLVSLMDQGLTPENLELVGLSLGAHVSSYAAKQFYAVTGKKPSRLTGLDPAGPCFRALPPELRLNSNDAEKVDVIHTNIDGFGIAEPLGQVDFYVNGGEFQPGDITYLPCLVICSHLRAVIYWWQSLEHPKKFIAMKCDSVQDARYASCFNNTETNFMGIETKFDRPGIFYLSTSNEFPYYRGKDGLKAENEIYTSVAKNINSDNGFVV